MKRVAILGSAGMLGSMLTRYFAEQRDVDVLVTVQDETQKKDVTATVPGLRCAIAFVDETGRLSDVDALSGSNWIINAIGVTQPYLRERSAREWQRAIAINSLLPFHLAALAEQWKSRLLHITTDGVFSGSRGNYRENDPHDAADLYGKTKSIGECPAPACTNLRCSVVGPERGTTNSLLEWFLHQQPGAAVNGFANHRWNGLTSLHFAKLCHGIIREGIHLPNVLHLVPADTVSKAGLLRLFALAYKREDVRITEIREPQAVDRTLGTIHKELNGRIWKAAGYSQPPRIEEMIRELSQWSFNRKTD